MLGSEKHADLRREGREDNLSVTLSSEDSVEDLIDECVDLESYGCDSGFDGFVKSGIFCSIKLEYSGTRNCTWSFGLHRNPSLTYLNVEAYRVR